MRSANGMITAGGIAKNMEGHIGGNRGTAPNAKGGELLDMVCERCGQSLRPLLLFAMMAEAGAELSWDVTKCPDGQEHKLIPRMPAGRAAVEGEDETKTG